MQKGNNVKFKRMLNSKSYENVFSTVGIDHYYPY